MSEKSFKETTTQEIFDMLSKQFEITYGQLLNVLREEAKYKRLWRIGEQQFFDAPIESTIEEESQKSRLCFAKINLLAVEIDSAIDEIISEKLQEADFLSAFKKEVLRAVLHLYSKEKKSTLSNISKEERKKIEEKTVLENIKDLSKYCAQNINDIRKQVIGMPVEEPTTSMKRKNTAEEKLEEIMDKVEIKEESEVSESENRSPSPDFSNEPGKISPRSQRAKKPNRKFAEENISTLRKESNKPYDILKRPVKINLSNGVNQLAKDNAPRKRGRPRKYFT